MSTSRGTTRQAEPVPYRWYYYDPARCPSTSPPTHASVLDTISSDLKDALHQLRALRATQDTTIHRLAQLERVIGVSGPRTDDAAPNETVVQHLASIQSAIALLARTFRASSSSPSSRLSPPGQETVIDPCHRSTTPQSGAQSPPAIPSSEKQLGFLSPPLEESCSPPLDLGTHEPSVGISTELATQCGVNFTRRILPHGRESAADAPSSLDAPSSGPTDPSSLTRVQIQTLPSQAHARCTHTEGVDCSMTSLGMSLSGGPSTFSAPSVLCPSSSATATLASGPGTSGSDSEQPYSNSEHAQMAFRANCDDSPVTNMVRMGAEPESLVQECHKNSSELASRLLTPPFKASVDDSEPRVENPLPRNHVVAADTTIRSHPCPLLKLPVISTSPSSTPTPSEEPHRGDPVSVYSGPPSPLTPMLSSYAVDGVPASRHEVMDISKEIGTRELIEERGDPLNNAEHSANEGSGGGVPVTDSPASNANAGLPMITVTSEPFPKVNSSRISRDVEPSPTPRSPPEQRQSELPEEAPGISSAGPEYTRFSSLASFTSASPSQCATPSESAGGLPTQDEDEVWHTLMFDASGLSTPAPGTTSLPIMASNQSSRASSVHPDTSQLLSETMSANNVGQDHSLLTPAPAPYAIDPSVLHDPPLQHHELPSSPLTSVSSLSSLTSIVSSDDVEGDGRPLPASSLVSISRLRATSEATLVDGRARLQPFLGGPRASLDELTVLARRAPPKIFLKIPKVSSSLKRKRDDMDHEGKGEVHAEVAARSVSNVQTLDISVGGSTSNPLVSDVEPSVSRGRLKKPSDLSEHGAHISNPRKKTCQPRRTKYLPHITHHIQSGRIVGVNAIAAPESQARPSVPASAVPSAPESTICTEGAGQGSRASAQRRKRKRQSNRTKATKATSASSDHRARSSPKKDEVWDSILQDSRTWPELPSQFEHWHLQFIQCDGCDHWYHYGCAGIVIDDPRLTLGAYFGCPPCHTQNHKRKTTRRHGNICKRPDCPQSDITGDTEVYYVERLVGRKRMDHATYLWLAKWDGYPVSEATWIPKENVVGNGTGMFDMFAENALEEGADLSQDLLLLQEALDAGFGAEDA